MNWPTCGTHAGRFGLPRCGIGARYGLSVSTSIRSSGHRVAAACTSGARLNVTMPEKRQERTEVECTTGLAAGPPVKQWKTVRSGYPVVGEHGERVVPRVARVDHQGEVAVRSPARSARRRPAAGRRGVSGRSSSRARTRRPRRCRRVSSRSTIVSTPLTASCGWSPTVANTPSWCSATAIAASERRPIAPDRDHGRSPRRRRPRRSPPRCRRGCARRARGSGSRSRAIVFTSGGGRGRRPW